MSHKNTGYPTQKPQELLKRLIQLSCPDGGLILDPFVGSGTTMRTAQSLGRNCIGIDSNKDAIETTRNSVFSQFPQTTLSVYSLHENESFASEHLARKHICERQGYVKTTSRATTTSSNELVLFAPLTRKCTKLDIEHLFREHESEISQRQRVYLWGFSFLQCNLETLPDTVVLRELESLPSFQILWEQQENRVLIHDVVLPELRKRLNADASITWQQLISSIRIQNEQTSDKIYIGTTKEWVPNEVLMEHTPCVITITDIISRSVSITISSHP